MTRIVVGLLLCCPIAMAGSRAPMSPLNVSREHPHYLAYEDGSPFFYLGDTAWELFRRTTREEADRYLQTRQKQGFTVIMACGPGVEKYSGSIDTGVHLPNRYGFTPFVDADFRKPLVVDGPDNDYWDHIDYVLDKCEELGLYVALLPCWARDYVPTPIDKITAYLLGVWYGHRYGDRTNVIWVLGGDNEGNNFTEIEIFDCMADGLAKGAGKPFSELLITYHCNGWQDDPHSSGYYLHDKPWLDFNGAQSGHYRDGLQGDYFNPPYETMADDYARWPIKPSVNLEAVYEDIYDGFQISNPRLDANDVRKTAYWTLFAGGAGYTYGHNSVWQFYSRRYEPRYHADVYWDQVLNNASAHQMTYMKRLLLSRSFPEYAPDQMVITSDVGTRGNHKRAIRARDGSYVMVYMPTGQPCVIDMTKLAGPICTWWFNPRDGQCYDSRGHVTTQPFGRYENTSTVRFAPPRRDFDWVLVLDDRSKGYPGPGR